MPEERRDPLAVNEEQNKQLVKSLNKLNETIKAKQAEKEKDTWDFRYATAGFTTSVLDGYDFAVIGPLVRRRRPLIQFLYIGPYLCSMLPSDPTSR